MNLRKVCNHPDLLEPRPVQSPLLIDPLILRLPRLCMSILSHDLARGYTGAVWQKLPTTGPALNVLARNELSIFNSFTINKLDASSQYYKLYLEERNVFISIPNFFN